MSCIALSWLQSSHIQVQVEYYYYIKNNQEILLDLADFALQEQPVDNLMVSIFWARYDG